LWRRQKSEEKTNGGSRYGRIRRKNWNEARVEHKLGHNNSCGSPRLIICLKELWLLANSKAPRFSGVRTWKQKKNRTSFLPFGEKKKKKVLCWYYGRPVRNAGGFENSMLVFTML